MAQNGGLYDPYRYNINYTNSIPFSRPCNIAQGSRLGDPIQHDPYISSLKSPATWAVGGIGLGEPIKSLL
jgi:hypothetical protein